MRRKMKDMSADLTDLTLRPLLIDDADTVAEIFFDAVLNGTSRFYSQDEREAWAGPHPDPKRWRGRIGSAVGLMADWQGKAAGFMTLMTPGLIDLAFVRPALAGRGIGAALLGQLEPIARATGAHNLETQASKAAEPFFARHGFETLEPVTSFRRGVTLHALHMRKRLRPGV